MSRKNILILIICGVVLAGLVLAGGVTAIYFYFDGKYKDALDVHIQQVADLTRSFEQGTGDAGVSLSEECDFTEGIGKKLSEASASIAELNEKYPLLLGKATDESAGVTALQARLEAAAPKIKKLREAIAEDGSVAKDLTGMLEKEMEEGSTKAYQALVSRNTALDSAVASLSFTGSLEEKRKSFSEAIQKRGQALSFFIENSQIQDEFRSLSADSGTSLADLSKKLEALLGQCEALEGKLAAVNLKGIAPDSLNLSANFNSRKVSIQASIDYLAEAATLQTTLRDYCATLDKAALKGKFVENLNTYAGWIAKLDGFEANLKSLNDKPNYANVACKRNLEGLGLSQKAKTVLSFKKAVKGAKDAMATSASIDTQITKLLANKSAKPASIKTSAQDWAKKNQSIITALSAALPDELKAGAGKVVSGCKERATFLNEWIACQDDRAAADSHNASYRSHDKKADDYAAAVVYYYYYVYGYWSSDVEEYYQLMLKEEKAANAEKSKANAATKQANAHKSKYEASRKKYLPLMNP